MLFAGFVAGMLFSGPLADRFGERMFAVLGAMCSAAGLLGLAGAWSYPTLLAACAVIGLGAGILDMLMSPIVSAACADRRAAAAYPPPLRATQMPALAVLRSSRPGWNPARRVSSAISSTR